jgi:hypothetical protein
MEQKTGKKKNRICTCTVDAVVIDDVAVMCWRGEGGGSCVEVLVEVRLGWWGS